MMLSAGTMLQDRYEILDRIGPGAQIEPGLREKADAMSGL